MEFTLTFTSLLLGCIGHAVAQPIIYEGYHTGIFTDPYLLESDIFCYSFVFQPRPGIANHSQYLAMFSDKFVENHGRVFTVKNANNDGGFPSRYNWYPNGLYEVSEGRFCVHYKLVYPGENIGQIVGPGAQFDPIVIIGVDQVTYKIYGYYQDSGAWKRQRTKWGYALDGSLVAEPGEDGEMGSISGISRYDDHPSKDGSMFNLYGDFSNFNYARHDDVKCAGRPAIIGDWTGFWAGSRGTYCPSESNNKLWKYTWHSGGSTQEKLGWKAASKIARLGPKSNIYGVSTNGNLLQLWHEKGVAVHSTPLKNISPSFKVRAVGGLDDGYGRGIFVSNDQDKVFNLHWESGGWQTKEINISYNEDPGDVTLFFGNRDGKTYLLYGWLKPDTGCRSAKFDLYRLNFVGGNDRYEAELVNSHDYAYFC